MLLRALLAVSDASYSLSITLQSNASRMLRMQPGDVKCSLST
jgi:hypothetical protein